MSDRIKRSKDEWLSLVKQQLDSGLSLSQFCRDNGLNLSTLHRHRTMFLADPSSSGITKQQSTGYKVSNKPNTPKTKPQAFIPISSGALGFDDKASPKPNNSTSAKGFDIELELGNGMILRINQYSA